MPLSNSRDYLSIGEVLENIRPDFPDVSISKIRFLESEGLINPERTTSGYRKFYPNDLERLRYILSLQRDHFMPLKVIAERLARADSNGGGLPDAPAPGAPASVVEEASAPAAVAQPDMTGLQMTRLELATAAGLSPPEIEGLEEFGILQPRDSGVYDEHDLLAAKAARGFFTYGVEPRHLRMYKQIAERESSFFEQIVSPTLRKRSPQASTEAAKSVHELMGLSRQLREAVLRAKLRELL